MPITQDRMIRLIQVAEEAQEQLKVLKQLADAYRKDPRIREAIQLAHSVGGSDASHPIFHAVDLFRQTLNEYLDLVEKENLSLESLVVLDKERTHFQKRQNSNLVARSYMQRRTGVSKPYHTEDLKLKNSNSNFHS